MSLARDVSRNLVAVSGSLSIGALGDKSGVSERTIVSARQGPIAGTLPNMRTIEKLAKGLSISVSILCAQKNDVVFWGKLAMREEYWEKDVVFESGKPDYQISRKLHQKHKLRHKEDGYTHLFLIAAFASQSSELAKAIAEYYDLNSKNQEMFI